MKKSKVTQVSEWDYKKKKPSYPGPKAIERAGHEIKQNPPAILDKTRKKKGAAAAKRQRTAILLSKARRGG